MIYLCKLTIGCDCNAHNPSAYFFVSAENSCDATRQANKLAKESCEELFDHEFTTSVVAEIDSFHDLRVTGLNRFIWGCGGKIVGYIQDDDVVFTGKTETSIRFIKQRS